MYIVQISKGKKGVTCEERACLSHPCLQPPHPLLQRQHCPQFLPETVCASVRLRV